MAVATTWRPGQARQVNDTEEVTQPIRTLKVDEQVREALPVAQQQLWQSQQRAPVAWAVGAHGGAGTSTLAQVFAPVGDAGTQWPAADEHPWCVVVCRSTRTGLDAAQSAVLQAHSGNAGGCEVLGVVIVADAPGKTPKALRNRETVLEELTEVWRVPYVPGFREHATSELAQWVPTAGEASKPESKRAGQRVSVTERPPAQVAEVGAAVFRAAFAAFQAKEQ